MLQHSMTGMWMIQRPIRVQDIPRSENPPTLRLPPSTSHWRSLASDLGLHLHGQEPPPEASYPYKAFDIAPRMEDSSAPAVPANRERR